MVSVNEQNILERLKKEQRFYLMGKTQKVLDAAIEYLESPEYITAVALSKKYGVSKITIRQTSKKICSILGIDRVKLLTGKPTPIGISARKTYSRQAFCKGCGLQLPPLLKAPRYCIMFRNPMSTSDQYTTHVGLLCPDCYAKVEKYLETIRKANP